MTYPQLQDELNEGKRNHPFQKTANSEAFFPTFILWELLRPSTFAEHKARKKLEVELVWVPHT